MAGEAFDRSTVIEVASVRGRPVHVKLNNRIRERCPQLGNIPSGATLPDVYFEPLHIVLTYLDGDESLSVFATHIGTSDLLPLFAQTWALAARLCLPALHNKLISSMAELYMKIIDREGEDMEQLYTANDKLSYAIRHLRRQFSPGSHAEKFLVCFIGRTAPLICELERQLDSEDLDDDVRKKILKEARSFERDPIKHRLHVFCVRLSDPPIYPPILVEQRSLGVVSDVDERSSPKIPSSIFAQKSSRYPGSDGKQPVTCDVLADGTRANTSFKTTLTQPTRVNPSCAPTKTGLRLRMPLSNAPDPSRHDPSHMSGPEEHQPPSSNNSFVTANEWPDERRLQVTAISPPPSPSPSPSSTYLLSITRPQPPRPLRAPPSSNYHHNTNAPCIFQVVQHNTNTTGNNAVTATTSRAGGTDERGQRGTVRAATNSHNERRHGLVSERKAESKKCRFFSLFTYGSRYG